MAVSDRVLSFWVWCLVMVSAGGAAAAPVVSWEPVGISGGGGMFAPGISVADPNLMMINCDMSAAYLSEDGGRHWRMIHHGQLRSDTRCRPGFHPLDTNVIYASSGGRLRVSRDRGRTFAPIGDLRESLAGEIAISPADPNVMLVGTCQGRCWHSQDAGRTWTVCPGSEGQVIGFHFERHERRQAMFAATEKGIWRSDDSGRTWAKKIRGLPGETIQGFAGGSSATGGVTMLYCTVTSEIEDGKLVGGVYRSHDRGESWQSAMGRGLNVATTTSDRWAYGPVAQYHQILTTNADPRIVYVTNTSTGFHPPHHETVYRSADGGATWRAVYYQDPRFAQYNVAPNYVTVCAGQSLKGGDTPFGAAICASDPNRLILVWSHSSITHNGGATWFTGDTHPAPGAAPEPGCAWACTGLVVTTTWNYYIDPFEANRHYIAYTDIGFARSLDAGQIWIWWDKDSWTPWRNTCYEIAFDPQTPGLMWGAFSDVHDIPNDNIISERHGHDRPGGVCLSRDFGATWQHEAQGLPAKPVTSIILDPASPKRSRTFYAGVFAAGVYKSIDGGKVWTAKSAGLGHAKNIRVSRVVLHADGTLLAMICAKRPVRGAPLMAEGVGLYRSHDGAETWEKVNVSQPFLCPKDFSVHPRDSRCILVGVCDANWQDRSGGLYGTDDGGATWRRLAREGRQTFGGYFHPKHEGWIYMTLTEGAPGAGLWLSRDDGRTWRAFDGLPFSNVQRVTFDRTNERLMYATTFGGSIWRGPVVPNE